MLHFSSKRACLFLAFGGVLAVLAPARIVRSDDASIVPPPTAPATEEQPTRYAAAFPVAPDLLITAAAALQGASKLELLNSNGDTVTAQLVRKDDATGLALLREADQKMSYFAFAGDFTGGSLQCAALPHVGLMNPNFEMLTGSAPAPAEHWKVRLDKHPHLPGAPLLVDGKIVGMTLGNSDSDERAMPAATLAQLRAFLGSDAPSGTGNATADGSLEQLTASKG